MQPHGHGTSTAALMAASSLGMEPSGQPAPGHTARGCPGQGKLSAMPHGACDLLLVALVPARDTAQALAASW